MCLQLLLAVQIAPELRVGFCSPLILNVDPYRLDSSYECAWAHWQPGDLTGLVYLQILEPGRRERLGLKMANEAAAKNRAKKQEALRRVTENLAR